MITGELPSRRRSGEGRPPDRDAREIFHKPADLMFREIQGLLLEEQVFTEADLDRLDMKSARAWKHDPRLYMHRCTVAVGAYWLSRIRGEGLQRQALGFVCGFDHDEGKEKIPPEILYASKADWSKNREQYMALIRRHPIDGYLSLLREESRYAKRSAIVAACHHLEQSDPYPSQEELRRYGIRVPKKGVLRSVVVDTILMDHVDGSLRNDQPLAASSDLTIAVRKVHLKERLPGYDELIDLAFSGIIA